MLTRGIVKPKIAAVADTCLASTPVQIALDWNGVISTPGGISSGRAWNWGMGDERQTMSEKEQG